MQKEVKKNIAMITMHKVFNYGSVLQTVALSKYISSLGHNVTTVDYDFPNESHLAVARAHSTPTPKISWFRSHLNGVCSRCLKINAASKLNRFQQFIRKNLTLSKQYNSESELKNDPVVADIYLAGSDQIWNPRYIGNDLTFALDWVPNTNKALRISYASSFGSRECPSKFSERLLEQLKKFDHLSVREENSILKFGNLKYTVSLDPTFLLNKEQWLSFTSPVPLVKGKYLLCYLLGYSYNPFPYADRLVKYIHKKTGLKVVMISGEPINMLRGYKLYNDCGPTEFINLFYHAEMVLTTSFHGTAFAINFNKPFISIINDKTDNDTRQVNLVKLTGLQDYGIVKCNTPLAQVRIPEIKEIIAPKLEDARTESYEYLKNILNGQA